MSCTKCHTGDRATGNGILCHDCLFGKNQPSDKCYLIVLNVDNQRYIQLTEDCSLHAYKTKKEAIDTFGNFRTKAKSRDYESFVSGSMGIINIQPHVIEVDANDPKDVVPFIQDMKPLRVHGKVLGAFLDFNGVKVSEDILKLSVFNVSKDIIDDVYGKQQDF